MQEYAEGEADYLGFSAAQIPSNVTRSNHLRACLICGLVKEPLQFRDFGCENCQHIVDIDFSDFMDSCTTTNFEGFLAVMQPTSSWVAKWQRISTKLPGCYAVVVHGRLSNDMVDMLHDRGIEYHPLDEA
jgi:transcription elongation factor SPT4